MSDGPSIPIIDVAPLIDGRPGGEAAVARRIGQACREIGFFYVTGHGIPNDVVADVFSQASRFFAAPASVKDAVRYTGASGNRGHVPIEGEKVQPGTLPDLKECFNIGLELAEDDAELAAGKPFRRRNVWPDQAGFRDTMVDYYGRAHRLGMALHRAFAVDLGIDPRFFDDKLSRPMATLRLLHYPPAAAPRDGQHGAGEHTDYGNLTLLATDEVGGLAVRTRAGRWIDAPVVPDALVCNIGDCLMRWTNDIYVSTPHRVASPRHRHRYSVVFFLNPNPDARVECVPSCLEDGGVAKYPPVIAADYLLSRLQAIYAHTG